MQIPSKIWLFIIAIMGLRLISMFLVPFMDTSEPRYAEIARLMVETRDWITPWFDNNIPFWGKPPLAFWLQAGSIKLLGLSEFAIRLPAWLATFATIWLVYRFARQYYGIRVGEYSALIYTSFLLVHIVAGTALMDAYLTFATTWALASFLIGRDNSRWYWRYGLFFGCAIGLLSKGPLALVIVFAPIFLWSFWQDKFYWFRKLNHLPWVLGGFYFLGLTLPWYVAAEIKTPGFLEYFFIGEHLLRFIDPGWSGDLYGSAHQEVRGTIWLFGIAGIFPWSLLLPYIAYSYLRKFKKQDTIKSNKTSPELLFLVIWVFITPTFFTFSGNILATYILPSLPAAAILLAIFVNRKYLPNSFGSVATILPTFSVPAIMAIATVWSVVNPNYLKTEKGLIEYIAKEKTKSGESISYQPSYNIYYYGGKLPFSARYYSKGTAKKINLSDLSDNNYYVFSSYFVFPKEHWFEISQHAVFELDYVYENLRYVVMQTKH